MPCVYHVTFYDKFVLRPLHLLLSGGILGVNVFFVLSGFLITYLLLQEASIKGVINVPYFYLRRVLRIWPLYFALLIFVFLIYNNIYFYFGWSYIGSNPLYFVSFLSNFEVINRLKVDTVDSRILNITWSVAIEEQFYLLWPLLFTLVNRRFYSYIFILIIAISSLFRILNFDDVDLIHYHTISAFGNLAIGGLSAYLVHISEKITFFFVKLSKLKILSCYVLLFFWLIYCGEFQHKLKVTSFFWIITSLFFAFIILEQNYSNNSIYKFSKLKILSKWGKYTYSLYLLHLIAIKIVYYIFERTIARNDPGGLKYILPESLLSLSLAMLMAYCSYKYFETFFLKLKHKFSFIKTRF
jgi:peptidoglycan/LPS O-acetylase OafA/YrhL